jgi:murein DD-endopeptidase MepM/ murein hydrolase activator NlpD
MNKFNKYLAKILLVLYLIFLHFILVVFVYEKLRLGTADISNLKPDTVPPQEIQKQTPLPLPSFSETAAPTQTPNVTESPFAEYPANSLVIPVKGVKREQIQDNYNEAREETRAHNAIDIAAPQGTPVVAAADGEIAKFYDSERGGITIYQYGADKKLVYYYAHLQRREDQIREKQFVRRGTVIGYVGDTGNAGAGNYHLHFAVSAIDDPNRYFEGTSINPFPLLKNGIEAN